MRYLILLLLCFTNIYAEAPIEILGDEDDSFFPAAKSPSIDNSYGDDLAVKYDKMAEKIIKLNQRIGSLEQQKIKVEKLQLELAKFSAKITKQQQEIAKLTSLLQNKPEKRAAKKALLLQNKPEKQEIKSVVLQIKPQLLQQAESKKAIQDDNIKLYHQALTSIQLENYPRANRLLRQYVSAKNGENLAKSYYWLGEVAFRQGDLVNSKYYFNILAKDFVNNEKSANAYLKLAIINEKTQNKAKARVWLIKLVTQYPQTSEANVAKIKLQRHY